MDDVHTVALFGEAEKGEFHMAYFCDSLAQLVDHLGHPPPESKGLYYAVQALLFRRHLIFFRVREEGFSSQDYLKGLGLLEHQQVIPNISAICIPGVGDSQIIHAAIPICLIYNSILVTTEADLYDYFSELKSNRNGNTLDNPRNDNSR
jgi:hypothetical protein